MTKRKHELFSFAICGAINAGIAVGFASYWQAGLATAVAAMCLFAFWETIADGHTSNGVPSAPERNP